MNNTFNYKGKVIDPSEGWKYGFPKACTEDCFDIEKWLVDNGYPQRELDNLKGISHIRFWDAE